MSTIYGTTGLGPATAKRQVYSPFEAYWNAFQEWRKRGKLRAELSHLTDSELADIGITRGEIDYAASHRDISGWIIAFSSKVDAGSRQENASK